MKSTKRVEPTREEDVIGQINEIVLLKIKAIIVRGLKKEDIPEFRQIVERNDPKLLFNFANERIPNLAGKVHEEIKRLTNKLETEEILWLRK